MNRYRFQNHFYLEIDEIFNATIGICSQSEILDIIFIDLPEPHYRYSMDEEFIQIESISDFCDVKAPITCFVKEINKELLKDPSLFNSEEDTWLVSAEIFDKYELDTLEIDEDYSN